MLLKELVEMRETMRRTSRHKAERLPASRIQTTDVAVQPHGSRLISHQSSVIGRDLRDLVIIETGIHLSVFHSKAQYVLYW